LSGKKSVMLNHLIECVRVPVAVKTKAHVEKGVPEPDIDTPTSFTAESTTAAVNAGQKRKRPQQTTFSVQKTRKYTFSKSEQDTFDEDVVKMTVSAGWTWNSLGDPEVRSFFTKYIPATRLPNPDRLSNVVLDRVVDSMTQTIKDQVDGMPATLQADGLKDITKKHIIAFLYTVNGDVSPS
jgi:hypothetical protein